ncbi:hypothetical protein HPP92_017861 [Vanilla planifolia]|uniref:Uncharacterized protein n=1 Tax=Vanilla planifolia TaxID=51239 RepID=A0A835UNZ6_VANPL|nr:hypothetical protein HPP92_017861 [Vanilla planifolia]
MAGKTDVLTRIKVVFSSDSNSASRIDEEGTVLKIRTAIGLKFEEIKRSIDHTNSNVIVKLKRYQED